MAWLFRCPGCNVQLRWRETIEPDQPILCPACRREFFRSETRVEREEGEAAVAEGPREAERRTRAEDVTRSRAEDGRRSRTEEANRQRRAEPVKQTPKAAARITASDQAIMERAEMRQPGTTSGAGCLVAGMVMGGIFLAGLLTFFLIRQQARDNVVERPFPPAQPIDQELADHIHPDARVVVAYDPTGWQDNATLRDWAEEILPNQLLGGFDYRKTADELGIDGLDLQAVVVSALSFDRQLGQVQASIAFRNGKPFDVPALVKKTNARLVQVQGGAAYRYNKGAFALLGPNLLIWGISTDAIARMREPKQADDQRAKLKELLSRADGRVVVAVMGVSAEKYLPAHVPLPREEAIRLANMQRGVVMSYSPSGDSVSMSVAFRFGDIPEAGRTAARWDENRRQDPRLFEIGYNGAGKRIGAVPVGVVPVFGREGSKEMSQATQFRREGAYVGYVSEPSRDTFRKLFGAGQ